MIQKKWQQKKPIIEINNDDGLFNKIFKIRGIANPKNFLVPKEESLQSPYLIGNAEKIANMIVNAIKTNKKIGVSCDSDFDGVASGTIMYRYLSNFVEKDNLYLLYNNKRKHGIEHQLDMVHHNTDMLIILDSSTSSTKPCKMLSDKGIEVVIVDHHPSEKDNPHAVIMNPYLCGYENKELCGTALTWKLTQIIDDIIGAKLSETLIDLAGIAMLSDIMSVANEENRYIIYQGLQNITNSGIKALQKVGNVKKISSQSVSYNIVPMVNGTIRLNEIKKAIDLLLEDDDNKCFDLAIQLKELNEQRKIIEKDLYEKVKTMINPEDKIICVIYNDINPGFNGLIASKISDEYNRPALMLNEKRDTVVGSFRSPGWFNLKEFFQDFKNIDWIVGHTHAGGIQFKIANLDKIKSEINERLENQVINDVVEYDLEIDISDINEDLINKVNRVNFITGKDFRPITFRINKLFINDRISLNNAVKFSCNDGGLELIRFRVKENWMENIDYPELVDVVGELNINKFFNWGIKKTVITNQIIIKDIMITE